jgi:HEAT repeat protein
VRLRIGQAVAGMGDPAGIPVLLEVAEKGDARLARIDALGTLARLAAAGPAPEDPDSAEAAALRGRIASWWKKNGSRLEWDAAGRRYRERR